MKYPRANNYLTYRAMEGDRCLICNYSGKNVSRYEVDIDTARFLQRLDGKTSPGKCMPGASREEVKALLCELKRNGLLRTCGKLCFSGFGSLKMTLWIPNAKVGRSPAPRLWNRLLMASWLPVLCMGVYLFMKNRLGDLGEVPYAEGQIFLGSAAGLSIGLLLHELSHGAAAMSYGIKVFEFGIFFEHFMPGAYTAVDERLARSRWQRIQIDAAGIEANLWLTGVGLIAVRHIAVFRIGLFMAASVNLMLGLSNLCFWNGLDGMLLFSEILGIPDLIQRAAETVFDRNKKRKLRRKMGISGYALLLVFWAVLIFQLLLPTSILVNLMSFRV